ncbi:glycoside hydrolase family 78 protein [Niabella aquatica]
MAFGQDWSGKWISTERCQSTSNTWLGYRKEFTLDNAVASAVAKIAVDSKYWLWINGEMVVFEGGLKRGPNPLDTYYEQVDIGPYLVKGRNVIAIVVWFFGKDGFSHSSSGRAGLLFDCVSDGMNLFSDSSWKCSVLEAYQTAPPPLPNYRLSESSILYDANKEISNWKDIDFKGRIEPAVVLGEAGCYPWNRLHIRPIPQWKNSGLMQYPNVKKSDSDKYDTLVCSLPYNAQVTPYLEVEANPGKKIIICTDNYLYYKGGSAENIRAEYITKAGVQEYESLGWMNGHKVYYIIPAGVKILDVKYRETGYPASFEGRFHSSDPFLNELWLKAQRTLYVNMRDTYMDCPERERAQWAGDAVLESAQSFYALSSSAHALSKKWLTELLEWQQKDGKIFAPAPAGNWNKDLPDQSLAAIGYYGLWNYYMHTGDKLLLEQFYDKIRKYIFLWKPRKDGFSMPRFGDWTWGDWGNNRDIPLLYDLWYYLAVKGMYLTAKELKKDDDKTFFLQYMQAFKVAFDKKYWTVRGYRSADYKESTDDRAQALAVLCGLVPKEKYPGLLKIFQTEYHASPYMEKYVLEAMMEMGYAKEALHRLKLRYKPMVEGWPFSTLPEHWPGTDGHVAGSVNHAWSGGPLIICSQNINGIVPLIPGYRLFELTPHPGLVNRAATEVASVAGKIKSAYLQMDSGLELNVTVPGGTLAIVNIPAEKLKSVTLNGKKVWEKGKYLKGLKPGEINARQGYIPFKVFSGIWSFKAKNI